MMAVASYGTKDYYKCKYCRYVAPFSAIVPQNYSVSSAGVATHKYVNNVEGLNYTTYKSHNYVNNTCTVCGQYHTHSFGLLAKYYNYASHIKKCNCGLIKTEAHSIKQSEIVNGRYANCLGCNARLDLTKDTAEIHAPETIQVSANGSYILPSGIVVLVDADIQAYENGTLQFYYDHSNSGIN